MNAQSIKKGTKNEVDFRGGKVSKIKKSEPWAQTVLQACRTGSRAVKILKNHQNNEFPGI